MTDNKVSRTIPCNHRVKEYNVFNLQRIAAMTIGEVYDSVSQSGGIVTKKCAVCQGLLNTLIDKVPMFKPSEPMSTDDQNKTAVFIMEWLTHLRKKLAEVSKPVVPVYLRDTVTQILQRQGHDIRCENAMISWYLGQYKTRDLDPEKIAQAIVEHKGTEWAKIKPLVKDAEYNIRLTVPGADASIGRQNGQEGFGHDDGAQAKPVTGKRSYMKGRHQEILAVFEYIESFPSTPGVEQLDEQLRHDLAIVKEVINWRQQATDNYSYREQFQFFLEQLQTIPDGIKNISFATLDDKTRKRLAKAQPAVKKKVKAKQTKKDEATPPEKKNSDNGSDIESHTETSSMPPHAAEVDSQIAPNNDRDKYQPTQEEMWESNKNELLEYLAGLSTNDPEAQRRVTAATDDIDYLSKTEDFDAVFEQLKISVQNFQKPYKGGFAVGVIKNKVADHKSLQQKSQWQRP